ncbi:hypothetical protein [Ferruginibacter sp. SUN106]|uniref:hypothetical protein n=1 Tax=Ferruginibacter sp. SUN106 TaxID=2978348 RepID=UPI003D35C7EF
MDDEQLNIFKEAFKKANNGSINFPGNFQQGKINEIKFFTAVMRGAMHVRFFIAKNETEKWYLDLFTITDDYSWHKRIEHDGTIINLENFERQFGWPVYPDDAERTKREHDEIRAINSNVQSVLLQKGLVKNFDMPDFEKENVVRLDYTHNDTDLL